MDDNSEGETNVIDGVEDVVPSLFNDYTTKYGTKLGEDWITNKTKVGPNMVYTTRQSQTGIITSSSLYPSTRSVPYTKRYYSSRSYNSYSKWKAMTYAYAKTGSLPNPASMASTYKNLLYRLGYDAKALKYYNKKATRNYRT